jgi:hypothetical protein
MNQVEMPGLFPAAWQMQMTCRFPVEAAHAGPGGVRGTGHSHATSARQHRKHVRQCWHGELTESGSNVNGDPFLLAKTSLDRLI